MFLPLISGEADPFHEIIVGRSRTGKSTLLLELIQDELERRRGFTIIDPHEELAASVKKLCKRAGRKFISFNESYPAPHALNPLEGAGEPHQRVEGFIDALRHQFGDSFGHRSEEVTRFAARAAMELDPTIETVVHLLEDPAARESAAKRLADREVSAYLEKMNEKRAERFWIEATAPPLNKLHKLTVPHIKKVTASSSFSVLAAMEEGTPMLFDLSTRRMGDEVASVLGSLVLSIHYREAFFRTSSKAHRIFVDEASYFAGAPFAQMMSRLAKKHVYVTLAYHSVENLRHPETIFGGADTLFVLRCDYATATFFQNAFGEQFGRTDTLTGLPSFEAYYRTLTEHTDVEGHRHIAPSKPERIELWRRRRRR